MFSNLILDLADFKDRVRPLARDIALMDTTRQYQKAPVDDLVREAKAFQDTIKKVKADVEKDRIEEGYSSRELEAPGSRDIKPRS